MESSPLSVAAVPHHPPAGSLTPPPEPISAPATYTFPQHKLNRRMARGSKIPVVLVACGSFSPITKLHLAMFQMSQRSVEGTEFEVVGKYLSPVSDAYGKASLVPACDRIAMCTVAAEEECKSRIMVDPWETLRHDCKGRPVYTRTVDVLRHFDHEINDILGGVRAADGSSVRARIVLLIGADVALTMGDPKVWAPRDLDVLLGYYGAFVVERPMQTDIQKAIGPLKRYDNNIWVVNSYHNDVSSTKIRAQLQKGEGCLDDLPDLVYQYIKTHGLYQCNKSRDGADDVSSNSDEDSP